MEIKIINTKVGKFEYMESKKWKWLNFLLGLND